MEPCLVDFTELPPSSSTPNSGLYAEVYQLLLKGFRAGKPVKIPVSSYAEGSAWRSRIDGYFVPRGYRVRTRYSVVNGAIYVWLITAPKP